MSLLKTTIGVVVLMLSSAVVVFSQANGKVSGTVTDANGAGVSGAAIKLQNQATKIETEATTNESGYFNFVNLNPAMYTLRVEVQGFKGAQTPAFDVGVNEAVTQNVSLTVGQVSETVEISTSAELIQQTSSDLGTVIPEKVVQDLPLNGRNFTRLLTLTPGVTPVSTSQNRSVGGVEGNVGIPGSGFADPSFHGQENRSKLYFFDGIINTNVRGPTYIVIPNIDLIQEFKVVGHDSRADYGGAAGGVVNMVSKSGGSSFMDRCSSMCAMTHSTRAILLMSAPRHDASPVKVFPIVLCLSDKTNSVQRSPARYSKIEPSFLLDTTAGDTLNLRWRSPMFQRPLR